MHSLRLANHLEEQQPGDGVRPRIADLRRLPSVAVIDHHQTVAYRVRAGVALPEVLDLDVKPMSHQLLFSLDYAQRSRRDSPIPGREILAIKAGR